METIGGCRIKDLGTDEALDVCWRLGAANSSLPQRSKFACVATFWLEYRNQAQCGQDCSYKREH